MGALRRLRGQVPGTRRGTILYAVGLVGAAALGVSACDPVDGGMNTSAVALTVDEMGTKELERQGADVSWLSCTASYKDKVTPHSGSAGTESVIEVDCQGETDDGTDISIKGRVSSVVDGACVRGSLTAKIGGKQWFQVDVLGNCEAGDGDGNGDGGNDGGEQSSAPPTHQEPDPTPTVTVTVTADPPPPRPTCDCLPGK
ncbi:MULTISPECIES: hypothetical protein [Streptomyces]|uniref:Uncharacterized protein n=1 Tax=Streptomyces venezuelae TaxID=54571 RepID=A0A5P2BSS1_STRVZ|nr:MULTISPECIES: hypothetical protein [Streptomyces]NEA04665.1 hypothetical protein [Streptomyces sp. SID10116]MYY85126.1 hypothetical protein [Streptomyces sp. SID335]MYZ15497.1 hypothetical protein [Streptomyces sp. SID337]MYZ18009.1 hypothetical protein [Streptomyces sp. SID337]NDZ90252.1 hypothetical protein [Streptomyces sp. SID10115]